MRSPAFSFLKIFAALNLVFTAGVHAATFFVAQDRTDSNPGSVYKPFATLPRAQAAVRQFARREAVTVFLRGGTYRLADTLVFNAADSGTKYLPVIYQAMAREEPVVSGGVKLNLDWKPYKDGIFQAQAPADLKTEEIFVNGERQILSRYPNFDPKAKYFDGFAPDAVSRERTARWADPADTGEIELLPALTTSWKNGKVSGLRVRGDYELSIEWENGLLKSCQIDSHAGLTPIVRYQGNLLDLSRDKRIAFYRISPQ